LRGRLARILRLRKLYFLRAEVKFAPTEAQRLFVLTIIIGVFCGLAAVAFHLSIAAIEHLVTDQVPMTASRWPLWIIVVPTLGALVCGVILHYVVPNARGSGIPQVKVAFATHGRIRARDAVGKFVIGALQIGTGSSLGREGPTVQLCAGIANLFGRVAGVSPKSARRLLPVGAAAGVAAAFNAPIAAVTFTIEEIVGKLDQAVLSGVIIAAALAAVIERSVLGEHPVFELPHAYSLQHVSSLAVYAFLGVAAAFVSIAFVDLLLWIRSRARASAMPAWARPAVGGLVTGVCAIAAARGLGTGGMTGGGYSTLSQALSSGFAYHVMLALCVLKIFATATSYGSGGAGGIFAPTLFMGAMLGGAVGGLDRVVLHHTGEDLGPFALVGMGAVFSGTIRAPMTSVLIIVEMTGGYSLILPLMLANMTAYILARRLRPLPIYEALLEQDGVHMADAVPPALDELPLLRASRTESIRTFTIAARAAEMIRIVNTDPRQDIYPVLAADSLLLGVIAAEDVRLLQSEPDLLPLVNAADLMRPPVSVDRQANLATALELMIANGLTELPVSEAGRYVGLIGETDIARVYLRPARGPMKSLSD
jgi:CIC family chloride channel protein